jgi:glycogen operon protein
MLFNGSADTKTFTIPDHLRGHKLQLAIDTSADSPNDIFPDLEGPSLISRNIDLVYKSLKIFVAEKS